jgi:hypothetical protein
MTIWRLLQLMKNSRQPKVSCFCATYGRPHLLEEAIESFLRQDYDGPKELVILNDYPGHTLHFDHPEITIVNVDQQIVPLGKKFNQTVSLCSGELFLPWEDDDIYLPWRISHSVANLEDGIFHTSQGWDDSGAALLQAATNLFQCNLAVSKQKWLQAGGYAEKDVSAIDSDLFRRLNAQRSSQKLPQDKVFYIYRWAGSDSYHGSALGGYKQGVSQSAQEFVETKAQKGEVPSGHVTLKPNWSKDWITIANASLAAHAGKKVEAPNTTRVMRPYHPGFSVEDSLVVPVPDSAEVIILDPLARIMWEGLYEGLSVTQTSELIATAFNIPVSDAYKDIAGIMSDWQRSNLLTEFEPAQVNKLRVGRRIVTIENNCTDVSPFIDSALIHLTTDTEQQPDCTFQVRDQEDSIQLIKDGATIFEAAYADAIAQRLIFEVVEEGYRQLGYVTILHAAAVKLKGHCIVLPALGGSGKTTLAAALMHQGAEYFADDVVPLMSRDGEICPLRTSLCLKENSWNLLKERFPDVFRQPVLVRDNKLIRYMPPSPIRGDEGETLKAKLIIFPKYQKGAKASIESLGAVDAFKKLISTATWFDTSIKSKKLQELVHWSQSSDAYELVFDTLEDGLTLINSLLDKKNSSPASSGKLTS